MENYINPIQKGLLVTEILQEWRFGSSHQTKNHEQIRCLLRAKEIQNEFWKTTVINTSYNHNTSHRNQDRNCHESVFFILFWISVSSVTQSCLTLCEPMDCSIQGFPVHHQLPELAQTHVYQVDDASQPSHPLSSPSSPAFNLSQHQGLFKWVSSSHQVAKVLEFQLQPQSFQWIFRTDFL